MSTACPLTGQHPLPLQQRTWTKAEGRRCTRHLWYQCFLSALVFSHGKESADRENCLPLVSLSLWAAHLQLWGEASLENVPSMTRKVGWNCPFPSVNTSEKPKKKLVLESRSPLPSTSQGPDWCAVFLLPGTTLWLLKCVGFQEADDFLCASCSKCYYEIPHVFHAVHW